mgnify:CR=1 FL=1
MADSQVGSHCLETWAALVMPAKKMCCNEVLVASKQRNFLEKSCLPLNLNPVSKRVILHSPPLTSVKPRHHIVMPSLQVCDLTTAAEVGCVCPVIYVTSTSGIYGK